MTAKTKPGKLIKLSSLKADLETEKNGKWIDYPAWPGVSFHVASELSPEFTAARDAGIQEMARLYPGEVPPEKRRDAVMQAYHDHILLDWKGLDEPLTPELKRQVFFDEEYRNVAGAVIWCSEQVARISLSYVEDTAKN
jgi:hypothetical protein